MSKKLIDSPLRHLPLVVVGAVAWGASWLLLPAHVNSQVLYPVVLLIAVHVVNQLVRSKRAPEMKRHYKTVFKNRYGTVLHRAEKWQVCGGNTGRPDKNVSSGRHGATTTVPSALCLKGSGAASQLSAWFALAVEVVSKKLLPQHAKREPALSSAVRASNERGHGYVAVKPAWLEIHIDGWMFARDVSPFFPSHTGV